MLLLIGFLCFKEHRRAQNTNSLSKRSLMRPHPVSGNSGLPMMLGRALGGGKRAAAGLVEEEEEAVDCIRSGWAAATSAAWTLGSRRQKEGGLALWKSPRSRPVLGVPRGAESASRLCRAGPVSGCIMLQLAMGCRRETETHGTGLGCETDFLDCSSSFKINSLEAYEILAGCPTQSNLAAVKWCSPIKTQWAPQADSGHFFIGFTMLHWTLRFWWRGVDCCFFIHFQTCHSHNGLLHVTSLLKVSDM